MNPITGNLYTLRSADRELLPHAVVFLYGTNSHALCRSLDSLERQTASHRFDVMILHDGPLCSTTYDELDDLDFSKPLRLLEINQPSGKSRCVNFGLAQSKSDCLLTLDAGDCLAPDALTQLMERLQMADRDTLGVYGNLEQNKRMLVGETSASRRRLFTRLARQKRIAPPLLLRERLQEIGGYPTDYPGEGWLLADTALALALLRNGTLAYVPDAIVRATDVSPGFYRKQDERKILQVLIRQASKRLQLPLPT